MRVDELEPHGAVAQHRQLRGDVVARLHPNVPVAAFVVALHFHVVGVKHGHARGGQAAIAGSQRHLEQRVSFGIVLFKSDKVARRDERAVGAHEAVVLGHVHDAATRRAHAVNRLGRAVANDAQHRRPAARRPCVQGGIAAHGREKGHELLLVVPVLEQPGVGLPRASERVDNVFRRNRLYHRVVYTRDTPVAQRDGRVRHDGVAVDDLGLELFLYKGLGLHDLRAPDRRRARGDGAHADGAGARACLAVERVGRDLERELETIQHGLLEPVVGVAALDHVGGGHRLLGARGDVQQRLDAVFCADREAHQPPPVGRLEDDVLHALARVFALAQKGFEDERQHTLVFSVRAGTHESVVHALDLDDVVLDARQVGEGWVQHDGAGADVFADHGAGVERVEVEHDRGLLEVHGRVGRQHDGALVLVRGGVGVVSPRVVVIGALARAGEHKRHARQATFAASPITTQLALLPRGRVIVGGAVRAPLVLARPHGGHQDAHRGARLDHDRKDLDTLAAHENVRERHRAHVAHLALVLEHAKLDDQLVDQRAVLHAVLADGAQVVGRVALEHAENVLRRHVMLVLAEKLGGHVVELVGVELLLALHELHEVRRHAAGDGQVLVEVVPERRGGEPHALELGRHGPQARERSERGSSPDLSGAIPKVFPVESKNVVPAQHVGVDVGNVGRPRFDDLALGGAGGHDHRGVGKGRNAVARERRRVARLDARHAVTVHGGGDVDDGVALERGKNGGEHAVEQVERAVLLDVHATALLAVSATTIVAIVTDFGSLGRGRRRRHAGGAHEAREVIAERGEVVCARLLSGHVFHGDAQTAQVGAHVLEVRVREHVAVPTGERERGFGADDGIKRPVAHVSAQHVEERAGHGRGIVGPCRPQPRPRPGTDASPGERAHRRLVEGRLGHHAALREGRDDGVDDVGGSRHGSAGHVELAGELAVRLDRLREVAVLAGALDVKGRNAHGRQAHDGVVGPHVADARNVVSRAGRVGRVGPKATGGHADPAARLQVALVHEAEQRLDARLVGAALAHIGGQPLFDVAHELVGRLFAAARLLERVARAGEDGHVVARELNERGQPPAREAPHVALVHDFRGNGRRSRARGAAGHDLGRHVRQLGLAPPLGPAHVKVGAEAGDLERHRFTGRVGAKNEDREARPRPAAVGFHGLGLRGLAGEGAHRRVPVDGVEHEVPPIPFHVVGECVEWNVLVIIL